MKPYKPTQSFKFSQTSKSSKSSKIRFYVILGIMIILALIAITRLFDLDTFEHSFLKQKSFNRSYHKIFIPANRGVIFDRNNIPLAVSTPLFKLVLDPKVLLSHHRSLNILLSDHQIISNPTQLLSKLTLNPQSRYLLASKHVTPNQAALIRSQNLYGVYLEEHYKTFYPGGISAAQLVGFTNFNNVGQDGIELSENPKLYSQTGLKTVYTNAIGQILGITKTIQKTHSGQNIHLSIDSRLQFIAYNDLKQEVLKVAAKDGAIVVLDPHNGEVLAAASYPGFNPNNIQDRVSFGVKNRAITDMFEPGSTMKPFTVASALESGKYTPTTPIDTSPGYITIQGHRIYDDSDLGKTNVTGVLKFSSNVGATKIALSLPWKHTYDLFQNMGFGQLPGGGFPGATTGIMHPLSSLDTLDFASMAFGYNIAVSALQLARAYAVFANGGTLYPVSFIKLNHKPKGKKVLSEKITLEIRQMLHTVVLPGGTAVRANIADYTVTGKTGTSWKVGPNGFDHHKYNAVFAGIVPLYHPRLVIIVYLNEPSKGYATGFGGVSAAPVFADIAATAMMVLGVPTSTRKVPNMPV